MAVNRRVELEDILKFRTTEQPVPEPASEGAVVKTAFAGVCHTDVHFAHDKLVLDPDFTFPRVLGHETSGIVHAVGGQVKDLKVGDRVLIYPWVFCKNCPYCDAYTGVCIHERGFGTNQESHVYGWTKDGGYENYVRVEDAKMLLPVPMSVPLDVASMIPCSGITSYSAVSTLKQSVEDAFQMKGKATIGMLGVGGLALWAIQIAKALYPSATVVAVDILKEKLDDAKKSGADIVHCWSKDASTKEAADGLIKACGYLDAAIDFSGVPAAAERAFYAMNLKGSLTFVGLGGRKLPSDLALGVMIFRSIRLIGNLVGSMEHAKAVLALVEAGKLKGPPVTYITLDQVAETILGPLAKGTQKGRAVVKF